MQNPQPNPYTPDEPVREAGRFFGREESLNWIDQRLSQHALIVVHGPPRIGISSLLIQLCQRVADRYQPTYLLIEGQSPREVMQQVTQTASVGVGLPAIASPQALREALGDSLYDPGRKPVLIALDGLSQWETRAKVDLLNALAALAATSGMLRFVVGWGVLPENGVNRDMPLRLDGLAAPANPIAQLRLSPLTRLHAMQLIADTARDRLKYDYHALERIWQESGGRPAMLQLIGCEVYERRALVGRASARDVQLALDDAVIRLAREMTEQWQYYTRQEQLVIGAAATVRGEHGLFSINHVLRELAANHVTFTADEVRDALAHLAQLDLVEPAGLKTYRFSSGLIRAWAARHAALPVVIGDTPAPVIPLAFDVISRRRARVWRAVRWLLLALAIAFVVTGPTIVSSLGPAPAPTLTPEGGRSAAALSVTPTPTRAPAVLPTLAKPVPIIAYSARKSDKEKWRVYVANQD
ncbi:MAG: hypothetical protein HYR71_04405, partial [Chloroflexi bacterium]|nr:hypothetical protein [Chloroflexota bacterium]